MLELRNITPDEFERWMSTESRAHGNRFNLGPEAPRPSFDLARSVRLFEDGQIVGGSHSHLLETSMQGGTSMVAGVSHVEVQSTHTRWGIKTQMMPHWIDGIDEQGGHLASLFATERAIFGWFEYGMGAAHQQRSFEKAQNACVHRSQRNLPPKSSQYGTLRPTPTSDVTYPNFERALPCCTMVSYASREALAPPSRIPS